MRIGESTNRSKLYSLSFCCKCNFGNLVTNAMSKYEEVHQQSPSKTFKFKYVAEEELLRIVRKVRREKQKEKDSFQWQCFVENRRKTSETNSGIVDEQAGTVIPTCDDSDQESEQVHHEEVPKVNIQSDDDPGSVLSEAGGSLLPSKRPVPTADGTTARETGTYQRIGLLRQRINLALDSIIRMIQCRPPEPDGPDDLERRKTRVNEFLSRFSRNYLFQFHRQVAELRRHIACASPETPGRHTEYQALMQKLVSAHQIAVQSLQAYLSQIPASLHASNIFGKLRDLLHHLCDLSALKSQLDAYAGLIDGYEDSEDADEVLQKCKELLIILDEKQADLEEVSVSARASSPPSWRGSAPAHSRAQRTPILTRTGGAGAGGSWRKTSAHLARAKFGAPSSARSSASAHGSSSRERPFHGEKKLRNVHSDNCCNGELKEIVSHMHDVICNKIARKKRRKSKHQLKSLDTSNVKNRSKSRSPQRTEVQNFSHNVQLVFTQHCERDDGLRDVATDTADLNQDNKSEGDNKKPKKVVWATGESNCHRDKVDTASDTTFLVCPHHNEDTSRKQRNASEQQVLNYMHKFQEYNLKAENPIVQRWCEDVLDGVLLEISEELEPSFLLEKMYQLEFKDS